MDSDLECTAAVLVISIKKKKSLRKKYDLYDTICAIKELNWLCKHMKNANHIFQTPVDKKIKRGTCTMKELKELNWLCKHMKNVNHVFQTPVR